MIVCLCKVFHLDSYWLIARLPPLLVLLPVNVKVRSFRQRRKGYRYRYLEQNTAYYIDLNLVHCRPISCCFTCRVGPIYPFERLETLSDWIVIFLKTWTKKIYRDENIFDNSRYKVSSIINEN